MYLAMNMPRTSGTVVARAPHKNRPMPCVFKPFTKPGPAEMPTTAMKMLSPTEFMNQTVEVGMRPKVGCTDRNHPATSPAMSAPPAVDSVSGTPATFHTSAPISAPIVMLAPMNATSATSVGRSGTPSSFGHGSGVLRPPDNVENVAAIDLRIGENRNGGRNGAACDFPQEDATCSG